MNDMTFINPSCDVVVCFEGCVGGGGGECCLNYEQQGAVGDGVADDTQAIQDTVDLAAAGGGTITPKARTYKVTGQITLASNVVINNAAGTVYDFSTAPADTILFYAVGAAAANVTVTNSVAMGATVLNMAAGAEAGFSAGDMVKLWSNNALDAIKHGELGFVQSVVLGQVTLSAPTLDAYTTGQKLRELTPVENVAIRGGTIRGSGTPAHTQQGVFIRYGENCLVEGVRFEDVPGANASLVDVLHGAIRDCISEGASNITLGDAFVLGAASRHCAVEDNYVRGAKSGIATAPSVDDGGLLRFLRVSGNTVEDVSGDNISLAGVYGLDVGGNTLAKAVGTALTALHIGSAIDVSVHDNMFQFSGSPVDSDAIYLQGVQGAVVAGNTVYAPNLSGTQLYGVRMEEDCYAIVIGPNEFSNTDPVYPSIFSISAGFVFLPWTGPHLIRLDTEGAAATDNLDNIYGLSAGNTQMFGIANSARDVTFRHAAAGGSLYLGEDFTLGSVRDRIVFQAAPVGGELHCVSKLTNEAPV